MIGIQDGNSTKTGGALGDYYWMDKSDDIVFGTRRGGYVADGSDAGLFCFHVSFAVSDVRVSVGFRSNLISLR